MARDYIVGGPLTETLHKIGDVHFESALMHLEQAKRNSDPREQLLLAAGALQNAYLFYDKSLRRGVPLLRRHIALGQVVRSRGMAIGCASLEALLQWYLEASALNCRDWLLRAKEQLISYSYDREESKDPWKDLRVASRVQLSNAWSAYYRMSVSLLPPNLTDPRPMYFRTMGEIRAIEEGLRAKGHDPKIVLGPTNTWPWWNGGFQPSDFP
jgi:hypothetical protein